MNKIETKERLLYLDILRTLAIFAVLIRHIVGVRWHSQEVFATSEWYIINGYASTVVWCIAILFMLSGSVLLDPKYNLTLKKLYTKSLPRLICALIFWAVLYRTLSPTLSILLDIKEVTADDWKRIYTEILFSRTPWHHLWFMYDIISIYILVPLLRVFTAHAEKKHYLYFLALYFVFGSLLPKINAESGVHFSLLNVSELYSYTGYFIAGYFFAKYDLTSVEKKILYILGGIAMAWKVLGSVYFAIVYEAPGQHFFENISPSTMILSFAVFVFVKNTINNSEKIQTSLGNSKLLVLISSCSLGIYLVHDFFNILLGLLNINTGTFPAIISTPLLALFVFTASFGVVLIIKKIPVLNKWII